MSAPWWEESPTVLVAVTIAIVAAALVTRAMKVMEEMAALRKQVKALVLEKEENRREKEATAISWVSEQLRCNESEIFAINEWNLSANIYLSDSELLGRVCYLLGARTHTTPNVISVNLGACGLGNKGACSIGAAIAANRCVTRVDVRGNGIAGVGALRLTAAVLGNPCFEYFNKIPVKMMRADSLT